MSLIHEFGTVIARITLDPAPFVDVSDEELLECMKLFTAAELDAMSLFNLPKEISKIPKVSSKAKQYIPVSLRPLGPDGKRAKIPSNYIPVAQRPLGPDGKRAKCFSKYIKKANRISVLV